MRSNVVEMPRRVRTARAAEDDSLCHEAANCDSSVMVEVSVVGPKAPNQDSSPIGAGRVERGTPDVELIA